MASDNNPWSNIPSQGNPYVSHDSDSQQQQPQRQQQQQQPPRPNQPPYPDSSSSIGAYQAPPYPPSQQQQPQGGRSAHPSSSSYYDNNNNPNPQTTNPNPNTSYNQPPSNPSMGIRRSDTEAILSQQPDRAEQVEHMQHYEASAPQSQDDKNQAQLCKEFPNIDSSLVAAIYNERRSDMSEVRELLQHLDTTT